MTKNLKLEDSKTDDESTIHGDSDSKQTKRSQKPRFATTPCK